MRANFENQPDQKIHYDDRYRAVRRIWRWSRHGSAIFWDLAGDQLPFAALDSRNVVTIMTGPFSGVVVPSEERQYRSHSTCGRGC